MLFDGLHFNPLNSPPYFLLPETFLPWLSPIPVSTVYSMDAAGLHLRLPYDRVSRPAQILGSWLLPPGHPPIKNGCQAWSLACLHSTPSPAQWGANLVHVRGGVSQQSHILASFSAWDGVPQALNSHNTNHSRLHRLIQTTHVNHHQETMRSSLCVWKMGTGVSGEAEGRTKYTGENPRDGVAWWATVHGVTGVVHNWASKHACRYSPLNNWRSSPYYRNLQESFLHNVVSLAKRKQWNIRRR